MLNVDKINFLYRYTHLNFMQTINAGKRLKNKQKTKPKNTQTNQPMSWLCNNCKAYWLFLFFFKWGMHLSISGPNFLFQKEMCELCSPSSLRRLIADVPGAFLHCSGYFESVFGPQAELSWSQGNASE